MKKGKMIVFEGLDYSFKETNTKRLYEYIKNNITEKVILLSFPNYEGESSKYVKKYLSGFYGEASTLDPYKSSIFYAMDRFEVINDMKIKEKLEEGYYIICDRYTGSNMTFQSTKLKTKEEKEKYLDWVTELEYKILGLPVEDIVIYMNMPIDISFPILQERKLKNQQDVDQHESNYKFMKEVESNALLVAKKFYYKNLPLTDTEGNIFPEDNIFNKIACILLINNIL